VKPDTISFDVSVYTAVRRRACEWAASACLVSSIWHSSYVTVTQQTYVTVTCHREGS